jgi:hypothetical protein
MAFATRSSVFAFVEEVTEGTPEDPAASDFTVVREGASFSGAVNTVTSDELRNSIGASKSFVTSQAPTASIPKYLKPSGSEGVAPDYSILIESCLGAVDVNTTEYTTAVGSTAGTSTTRANLKVTAGVEANFQKGQAVLIKDATNNYAVRNVWNGITSTNLPLSFNLGVAPATGIGLGKAVLYLPSTSQPTYTSHMFQSAASTSAVHQMIAGCRTTAMNAEFTANELAAVTFEIGGIQYYINPIEISSLNKWIDFTDSVGTVSCQLALKFYATPIDLANEIASKMTAASSPSGGDVITCTWSNTTGKFTIASDGSVLSLLWNTGSHTANSAKTALGFSNSDDTGALTYTSDTAQTYYPAVTPDFDSQPPQVVRDNMLELGTFADYLCVGGQALTISISTPKTDVPNWCAETGIDESVVLSREVTISGTLKFQKHDIQRFYNLINNVETQLAFVHGQKIAGNWVPGTIVSIFCPTCSVTSNTIADQDGYIVEQFEATAFVGDDLEDIYINFL